MSNLQGMFALVTGGTSGIGLATARAFRDAGARVIVTGSNPETLAKAREALGDSVIAIRSDARSVADAKQLAAEIQKRFGGLDIAFLNAGVAKFMPLGDSDAGFLWALVLLGASAATAYGLLRRFRLI